MQRINYFCIDHCVHIWLNIKMILSETNSTVSLNLIDRIMQNKLTNNLFWSINLAMSTIYMQY